MKKGFTLIELLAVIVILAIVALIITPVISGVIKNAKKSADLRSAEGYVKAGENFYYSTLVDENKKNMLGKNVINNLDLSNKNATGKLVVNTDGTIDMSIIINDKCYRKSSNQKISEIEITNDIDNCVQENLYDIVISSFPTLEIGDDGCKTLDVTNYKYMGGCYIKGKNTNNYLWYSGFLWRIMGINNDKTIRLITEENIATTPYDDDSSSFLGSNVEGWLNNYFFNLIRNNEIIKEEQWCDRKEDEYVTNYYDANRTTCSNTTLSKIGLISLDEYNLSYLSSYIKNSLQFRTLTPCWNNGTWSALDYKTTPGVSNVYFAQGIRPVINVNPNTKISTGNGLLSDIWNSDHSPYIVSENKSTSTRLSDKVVSGEYVLLADKLYRVVSVDKDGNTKIILDGFYQELNVDTGVIDNKKISYGSTAIFTPDSGIGLKVNTDVLEYLIPSSDNKNRSLIKIDNDWYNITISDGDSYLKALDETATPIKSNVGLIRTSEILSGQSYTMISKNGTVENSTSNTNNYWTINPYSNGTDIIQVNYAGSSQKDFLSHELSIRPIIVINSNANVISGLGTPSSPYKI